MFLYLSDRTISEFCTRWIKLNNYEDEFLPFGPNQHFTENQTKDILYKQHLSEALAVVLAAR
jgi:hypothetical protein